MATEKGRAIRPDLKCGICGEHGGEPVSYTHLDVYKRQDVRRALGKKEHLDVNDFMALISPAATPYLEVMARLSQKYLSLIHI